MSLLFMDGLDNHNSGPIEPIYGWTKFDNNTDIISGGGRFGGNSIRVTHLGGNEFGYTFDSVQSTLRIAGSFSRSGSFRIEFKDENGNNVVQWESDDLLILNDSNVTNATSFPSNSYSWYEVELVYGASGSITVYINGAQSYTNTHDLSSTGSGFKELVFTGDTIDWDDFIFWNNDGSGLSSFPIGDSKITKLTPTSTVTGNFTAVGDSSNELTVDDDPGFDGDSTYNESKTVGARDTFGISDLTNTSSILGLQVVSFAKKDDAGTRTHSNVITSGTTTQLGTEKTLLTSYSTFLDIYDNNPDTGTDWTETEVNNLQIGYEVRS